MRRFNIGDRVEPDARLQRIIGGLEGSVDIVVGYDRDDLYYKVLLTKPHLETPTLRVFFEDELVPAKVDP